MRRCVAFAGWVVLALSGCPSSDAPGTTDAGTDAAGPGSDALFANDAGVLADAGADAAGDAGPPDGGRLDAGPPDAGPPPPEVTTSLGTVRGMRGAGFQGFLGIPYAEPPVGARRWAPPAPHPGWTGVRVTDRRPPACPQELYGLFQSGNEDCLFLNVHTPDPRPQNAPVMVWIHGGAFVFGEGVQTDGATMGDVLAARYGMVVVSLNYRLGPFGFFRHPSMPEASGNQGFEDQQLALEWVRDHIADFGGDPANVTIVGESAGGVSVCAHLIAPRSRGLFARAISESGLCDAAYASVAAQESAGATLATTLGCDGASDIAACLRGKTVAEIQATGGTSIDIVDQLTRGERVQWIASDGTVIPGSFRERVEMGEVADVPVILGWNADEGTLFVALAELSGNTVDMALYETAMTSLAASSGVAESAVRAAYPVASYSDPGFAIAAALGHYGLACPSRRAARLLAEAGRSVWVYRFEFPDASFQLPVQRDLGAFHSAEIQFVFGHRSALVDRTFDADETALHDAMSGYWSRFVASGDPNGAGAPMWPAYEVTTDRHLVLDRTVAASQNADRDPCVLWDVP